MNSSSDRCLLTRRNHINIHMCSCSYCCRGKLLKSSSSCPFDTLSVLSRNSCANLNLILAIVTAAAAKLAFLLHTTRTTTSEWLRHVSFSSPQVVEQTCLLIKVEFPSRGLQLLVWTRLAEKLSSSTPCVIAARRRRFRSNSTCFSLSAPGGRNVGYLSACSSVALAIRKTGVVNGLRQAST